MKLRPNRIKLIITVRAHRRFSVQSILIHRIAIPNLSRIAIPPNPLFLSKERIIINRIGRPTLCIYFMSSRRIRLQRSNRMEYKSKSILMFKGVRSNEVILFMVRTNDSKRKKRITFTVIRRYVSVEQRSKIMVIIRRGYKVNPPRRNLKRYHAIMGLRVSFGVNFAQVRARSLRTLNTRRPFRFITPRHFASIFVFFSKRVDKRRDK